MTVIPRRMKIIRETNFVVVLVSLRFILGTSFPHKEFVVFVFFLKTFSLFSTQTRLLCRIITTAYTHALLALSDSMGAGGGGAHISMSRIQVQNDKGRTIQKAEKLEEKKSYVVLLSTSVHWISGVQSQVRHCECTRFPESAWMIRTTSAKQDDLRGYGFKEDTKRSGKLVIFKGDFLK